MSKDKENKQIDKKKEKEEKDKKQDKKDKEQNYEEKYKRALADYQNLLKRTEAEKQELAKFANEQLLLKIIPIYDNLRLAWEHLKKGEKKNNVLEGLGYILKQFKDVLVELGVKEIETKQKVFDPQTMEAVETEKTTDKAKDNLVAREIKPGYCLHDRTLIPARVVVYKWSEEN